MALVRDLSAAQIAFQLEDGEIDQFLVLRYRGTEGVCQLYRFEIELTTTDTQLSLDDVVGRAAVLSVDTAFGKRFFHGVVGRLELTGHTDDGVRLRAELVPWVWLLTHRYHCRIFQQKTTRDIIAQVLEDGGLPADRFQFRGVSKTQMREYCVQYRETDFNFICRLMEEEGIHWFFDQTEEGHVLVMADANDYPSVTGDAAIPFVRGAQASGDSERVSRFRIGQAVRPGAVVLRDFSFENPTLNLEVKADNARDAGLEFSDYPGEYVEQSVGNKLAKLRAEEFECLRITGTGTCNSPRVVPGRTFDLTDFPVDTVNQSYLIISATYEGKGGTDRTSGGGSGQSGVLDMRSHQAILQAQRHETPAIRELAEALLQIAGRLSAGDPTANRAFTSWLYHAGQVSQDLATIANASGEHPLDALTVRNLLDDVDDGLEFGISGKTYDCTFECIPSSVTYRPARVTPWPVVGGTQTARVVGPSGEEIHTDEFGRVKVQFNWDRDGLYDDKSSCWIRVSQAFAGGQYGMMFLPRVGQEVVVDFLDGDPDKPIIVGRVFNQDHMPAYTLPDEKTKSYIKTNSSTGGGGTNEIRFEDAKDSEQLLINAQKDFHVRVGNQERHNVKENQFLTVEGEQRSKVDGNRSAAVGGDDAVEVTGKQSLVVKDDALYDYKANHDHKVASEYHIKADKLVVEATSGISLKTGGNFVLIDSSGVTIVGTQIKLNSGGAALSSSISGSPAAPAAPEDADEVTPGKDANYSGEASPIPPIEPKKAEGHWISIDLKYEDGEPAAGEYYEITTPGGTVLHGTLDVNGFARRWVKEAGECKVTFPNLHEDDWDGA